MFVMGEMFEFDRIRTNSFDLFIKNVLYLWYLIIYVLYL